MSEIHAIAWVDHQHAQVLVLDGAPSTATHLKAHAHYTRQHGSSVRAEHEFFGQVCDAFVNLTQVLVVGPKVGLVDFRHYVEKHRAELARRLVGYEVLERQTEPQLLAYARVYFTARDTRAVDDALERGTH